MRHLVPQIHQLLCKNSAALKKKLPSSVQLFSIPLQWWIIEVKACSRIWQSVEDTSHFCFGIMKRFHDCVNARSYVAPEVIIRHGLGDKGVCWVLVHSKIDVEMKRNSSHNILWGEIKNMVQSDPKWHYLHMVGINQK